MKYLKSIKIDIFNKQIKLKNYNNYKNNRNKKFKNKKNILKYQRNKLILKITNKSNMKIY